MDEKLAHFRRAYFDLFFWKIKKSVEFYIFLQ